MDLDTENNLLVASVSGGKDSTAMALHLVERGLPFTPIFCDTGWEHPDTYAYLDYLEKKLGVPIVRLRAERQMVDLIRHKRMFPSGQKQFCTEELKIVPLARWIEEQDRPVLNAVGVRAEESRRRALFPEREWSPWLDCEVVRPIFWWTLAEVVEIHRRHDFDPNPLYLRGASRVGCWPCIHSRKAEIRAVAETDPDRVDLIEALEKEISERAGAPRSFFRSARRIPGPSPVVPIRRMVEWSRTAYGGKDFEDWDPEAAAREGCMRWGMCATEPEEK